MGATNTNNINNNEVIDVLEKNDAALESGKRAASTWTLEKLGKQLSEYIKENFTGNSKQLKYALELPRTMVKVATHANITFKLIAFGEYINSIIKTGGDPGLITKETAIKGVSLGYPPYFDEKWKEVAESTIGIYSEEFETGVIYSFGPQARGFLKKWGHSDKDIDKYIESVEKYNQLLDLVKKYKEQEKLYTRVGGGNPNAETPSMAEDRLKHDPSMKQGHYDPSMMTEGQYEEYLKNKFRNSTMTEDQQLEHLREWYQENNIPINNPVKVSVIGKKPNIFPITKYIEYIIEKIGFASKYSDLLITNIGFCKINSTITGNPNTIENSVPKIIKINETPLPQEGDWHLCIRLSTYNNPPHPTKAYKLINKLFLQSFIPQLYIKGLQK